MTAGRSGIKVMMFDLGNVLLFFSHELMFRRLAGALGCDAAKVERELTVHGKLHQLESGQTTASDFFRELRASCFGGDSSNSFSACSDEVLGFAMSDIFTPNQPLIDKLLELKAEGIKLVLVSNTSSLHFEFAKKNYPWLAEFDAVVLSYEVRAMKPEPAFYSAALGVAGDQASSCLFIDDLPANVAGAADFGFSTHLFRSNEAFFECLQD